MSTRVVDPPSSDDWEGHWFNPVAFAEQWYENEWPKQHPQEFGSFVSSLKRKEKSDA